MGNPRLFSRPRHAVLGEVNKRGWATLGFSGSRQRTPGMRKSEGGPPSVFFWTTSGDFGGESKARVGNRLFFWTTSRDFGGERKARVGNPRFFLDHFAGLRVKKKRGWATVCFSGPRQGTLGVRKSEGGPLSTLLDHFRGFWRLEKAKVSHPRFFSATSGNSGKKKARVAHPRFFSGPLRAVSGVGKKARVGYPRFFFGSRRALWG